MATSGERRFAAGCTLAYSTTSGGTYTALVGIKSIKPAGLTYGKSKETDLGTAGPVHEYGPGWGEPGEITLTAYYDDVQRRALDTIARSRTRYFWKLVWPGKPSGETTPPNDIQYGYISKIDFDNITADSDDKLTMPMSIQTSGLPTLNSGVP
jgi:hypothetical protein